jgi:hypothetical protein
MLPRRRAHAPWALAQHTLIVAGAVKRAGRLAIARGVQRPAFVVAAHAVALVVRHREEGPWMIRAGIDVGHDAREGADLRAIEQRNE